MSVNAITIVDSSFDITVAFIFCTNAGKSETTIPSNGEAFLRAATPGKTLIGGIPGIAGVAIAFPLASKIVRRSLTVSNFPNRPNRCVAALAFECEKLDLDTGFPDESKPRSKCRSMDDSRCFVLAVGGAFPASWETMLVSSVWVTSMETKVSC
jgi:hypothetical protein